jgi:hypothetical protein
MPALYAIQDFDHEKGRCSIKSAGVTMEEIRPGPYSPKQDELIRRYCREAEAVLASAADYPSALRMKQSLCQRFEKECDSTLVVSATRQFLESLLKQRWGKGAHGSSTSFDPN